MKDELTKIESPKTDPLLLMDKFDQLDKDAELGNNRIEQLEQIAQIQIQKQFNDDSYNTVIDKCNDEDQKVAEFFAAVKENDFE